MNKNHITTTLTSIFLLMISTSFVWAQLSTSATFRLDLERDEDIPTIYSEQKNDEIIVEVRDNSGLDTIWFNSKIMLVYHDSLSSFFTFSSPITSNDFVVKAVDIRGNSVEKTYMIGQRGVTPIQSREMIASINNARYYALLIGVESYDDPSIRDLDEPISDVEKLYTILTEDYTFDPSRVQVMKNPTEDQIEGAFDSLKDKIGESDNLLIFFAGHGFWNESSETGFWYPADAEKNRFSTWVRNSTIRDYIKEINSRHTLLIADACFSGSIFKSRGEEDENFLPYNHLYSKKSRKAMTSGTLQNVPDKSIFMKYLLMELKENTNRYLRAQILFSKLSIEVDKFDTSNKQDYPEPAYGTILDTGDENGDFIFIRRKLQPPPVN